MDGMDENEAVPATVSRKERGVECRGWLKKCPGPLQAGLEFIVL